MPRFERFRGEKTPDVPPDAPDVSSELERVEPRGTGLESLTRFAVQFESGPDDSQPSAANVEVLEGGDIVIRDVESPEKARNSRLVTFGDILDMDDRKIGELKLDVDWFAYHGFITGATGAGKSQTTRHLLDQLTKAGVPWLVMEPAKSEYGRMAGRLEKYGPERGRVYVIDPSDPEAIPLSINPFAPEPGYPIQDHIDTIRELINAAFDSEEPFPQIVKQATQALYEMTGWDPKTQGERIDTDVPASIPTIRELEQASLTVIEEAGYGQEIGANVSGFVRMRTGSMRAGTVRTFLEGGHPTSIGDLLNRNVVLQMENIGSDNDKAFVMGAIIIRIAEFLRMREAELRDKGLPPTKGVKNVVMIEEAHRLLRNVEQDGTKKESIEMFANLLAEVRAYGQGVLTAEQVPTKILPDVIKNTGTKIVHALSDQKEREAVGSAMNLDDEQMKMLVRLRPGEAMVMVPGLEKPLRIKFPYGEGEEKVMPNPDAPISGRRSPGCGPQCKARACNTLEMRRAEIEAASATQSWLRTWSDTAVKAALTGNPLPEVPANVRNRWNHLDERLRECALADIVTNVVARYSTPLRDKVDPNMLVAAISVVGRNILEENIEGADIKLSPDFVIPQIQVLHELDKIGEIMAQGSGEIEWLRNPEENERSRMMAPPLDYPLEGVEDDPDTTILERIRQLSDHPASPMHKKNRRIALEALYGVEMFAELQEDFEQIAVGQSVPDQIRMVVNELNLRGEHQHRLSWYEKVFGWSAMILGLTEEGRIIPPSPKGLRQNTGQRRSAPSFGTNQ